MVADGGIPIRPLLHSLATLQEGVVMKGQPWRGQMERTASMAIREEGKDLKDAAEQTLNVILDLTLGGKIRWASPNWQTVIGIPCESIQGKPISDFLIGDKLVFDEAVQKMQKDDSNSRIVRFSVEMGPDSLLNPTDKDHEPLVDDAEGEISINILELEAQGIIVYDRTSGGLSHVRNTTLAPVLTLTDYIQTMWMIRPSVQREVIVDLPEVLVESLGVGAEMLAHHLTALADVGTSDPQNHPPPLPVLCRICERQLTPWWFPKHTELCLQEHRAEADLQQAQENLTEHRNAIVKILDALEAQTRHRSPTQGEDSAVAPPQADYKGLPIGLPPTPPSECSSGRGSSASPPGRSRPSSGSGLSHHRIRSFAVRRPLSRIVELVLDLCDTALEISTPAITEGRDRFGEEVRTQSPQSEGRMSQVLQWQSPSASALAHEAGLAALCDDTAFLSKAKVESILRFRRVLEYSERIRNEFTALVQDCIDAALAKAAKIAAGEFSSDSSDELVEKDAESDDADDDEKEFDKDETPETIFATSLDGPSTIAAVLQNRTGRSGSVSSSPHRQFSSAISTRSNSPKGAVTPRSAYEAYSQATIGSRLLRQADFDPGAESDTSVRSSVISSHARAGSPASEMRYSRITNSRELKRTSLVLTRTVSASRQHSPARNINAPVSPLLTKPRLASGGPEVHRSPTMSPSMSSLEFCSPIILAQNAMEHRRQSSATSDMSRIAVSPRLSMSANPQPRAVVPSIRDFEIIKPISKGAFGSVYLAKKKSTGDYYAIKALKKADMVAKNQVANVKAERAILMFQGESDFVAKLYWTFPSKDFIFLVMEYLNGGDCAALVHTLGNLSEEWAKRYLAEVVLGVEHLHSREIVHRDLKPDNLLIDQKGHLKLTDFGLSRMGLIGRQKRALSGRNQGPPPDPLKQTRLQRSVSGVSSRSASFDYLGVSSPGLTPNLTPVLPESAGQPSYFSLSRETSLGSREPTRQSSGHQSDAYGDGDSLQAAFRRFSLYEDPWNQSRQSPKGDESMDHESPGDGSVLQYTMSNVSNPKAQTPPQVASMLPPPMALYDPEDQNRRFVGTPDYLAPETINGLGQDEMSDWWSLGCILFEFLFGYPPFHAETPDQVFENILARKIDWPDDDDAEVSTQAVDLINQLLCIDPSRRLGSNMDEKFVCGGEQIRSHPWFSDIDWITLNETQASFIPAPENPEDTEYFDTRGATTQDFATEFEDQNTSEIGTPNTEYYERPHDALSRVRNQVNSMKRGLMPLHIPPHVRDGRTRRLSESVLADDFGQFSFKNLPVLEKANKDVIQKLRAEAMQAQARSTSPLPSTGSNAVSPSLDGNPTFPIPTKMSAIAGKGHVRSASPSMLSVQNSSPSRASQPSSPLVQFSAGQHHERRKTSSGSSTMSHSVGTLQPGSFFDVPRLSTSFKTTSTASSPIKMHRSPLLNSGEKPSSLPEHGGLFSSSTRSRSHTVGSNDSDVGRERLPRHRKQRNPTFEGSPPSSDTEDPRAKALLRVQRRRQSSRRLSQITMIEGPMFRPLDVLVCEDHPVSRLVMEKLLEKLRCRTIIVQNGAEAMRYAMSSVKFDIIMMEFKLPQINGADVARMIRDTKNANSHTPIVAVTGYLKELQAPHHFDALVEKPPSMKKLTDVMSTLCQWRAPPPGWNSAHVPPVPPSNLRKESYAVGDSPTSTSSSSMPVVFSSCRGSSKGGSMSSISHATDMDSRSDTVRRAPGECQSSGLGISPSTPFDAEGISPGFTELVHADSAPASLESKSYKGQSSAEAMSARKKSLDKKRQTNGESGDDEDDELGDARARSRSPLLPPYLQSSSKLSTEMLRSDSQGSVVSVINHFSKDHLDGQPPALEEAMEDDSHHASITPPVIFPKTPGGKIADFELLTSAPMPRLVVEDVPDHNPSQY